MMCPEQIKSLTLRAAQKINSPKQLQHIFNSDIKFQFAKLRRIQALIKFHYFILIESRVVAHCRIMFLLSILSFLILLEVETGTK